MHCIDSALSAFMFNDGQLPVSTINPIDTRVHRILGCFHVSHINIGWNIVFWHHGPISAVHAQGDHSVSNIMVLSCVKFCHNDSTVKNTYTQYSPSCPSGSTSLHGCLVLFMIVSNIVLHSAGTSRLMSVSCPACGLNSDDP